MTMISSGVLLISLPFLAQLNTNSKQLSTAQVNGIDAVSILIFAFSAHQNVAIA